LGCQKVLKTSIMKKLLSLYIILLFFTTCHGNKTSVKNDTIAENKDIVLIFKPCNYSEKINTGVLGAKQTPVIKYIGENLIPIEATINNDGRIDTLIIQGQNSIITEYVHLSFVRFYYCLNPGDTAVFSYEKYKPICTINGKADTYYNTNFFMEQQRRRTPDLIPNIEFVAKKDLPKQFQKAIDIHLASAKFLDSLFEKNKIKDKEYREYQTILKYNRYATILNYLKSSEDARRLYLEMPQREKEQLISCDSLIFKTYYHDFLNKYLASDVLNGEVIKKSATQRTIDYVKGYENISAKLPTGKSKDILLFNCLLGVYSNYPFSDFQRCYTQFKSIKEREQFVNYIDSNLLFAKDIKPDNSILLANNNEKIAFQELLNINTPVIN
jgi:hypothetical protein